MLPCREAAALMRLSAGAHGRSAVALGHLPAARAKALSLRVWAVTWGSATYQVLLVSCLVFGCFILFVLVIIPLGWIEAELNFSSAARHDRAAGSYPRAELAPLFLPNVH